jgi:hypothetical protein
VAEEHGIVQKFFGSVAYLFVYDLDVLPKDLSRYFYPISIERAWTFSAVCMMDRKVRSDSLLRSLGNSDLDKLSNLLSRMLVDVARQYVNKRVSHADDAIVYEIYTKAFSRLLGRKRVKRGC